MKKYIIKEVFKFLKKYKIFLIISFILSIIVVSTTILVPYYIGITIDYLSDSTNINYTNINQSLLIILGLVIITSISQFITLIINNYVTYNVTKDIRNKAFEKIEMLPLSYIDSLQTGKVVNIITTDCEQFGDGLLMFLTQFFTSILTIFGVIGFMISINIWVALFVIFFTPISLFVAKYISKKSFKAFDTLSKERGEQMAILDEYIGEQKVIQSYGIENLSYDKFNKINNKLSATSLKATFVSSLVNPSTRFINSCIYAGVALIGALISIKDDSMITIGSLTCLLGYANQYMKPFNEISGVIAELQNSLACIQRVFNLINKENEVDGNIELNSEIQKISLDNVNFSYDKTKPILKNINITVKEGQKIAIVGPTGCGKTTLINLLMRFYKTDNGYITINGNNINDYHKHSIRRKIGMVLQDTWIFYGSIKDNLTMGDNTITENDLIEVCKKVKIYNFIMQQKDGFNSIINDDSLLSVGQKQLLCIARVMLIKPKVLILDEATSNIDTRTEIIVQNAFDELMKDKTSIIVAHRLSTIREANTIIALKDGKVIESGNHLELLDKKGLYYQIYNSQFINSN